MPNRKKPSQLRPPHVPERTFDEHQAGVGYRQWLADGGPRNAPDPHEMMDAAWECQHGRLPHDAHKNAACRCWDREPGGTVSELPTRVDVQAWRRRRAA